MSDTSAVRQHAPSKDSSADGNEATAAPAGDLKKDPRADKTESLRRKVSGLQGLKITASPSVTVSSSSPAARKPGSGLEQEREEGASGTTRIDTEEQHDTDEEAVLVLNPVNPQIRRLPPTRTIQNLYVFGAVGTALWVAFALIYAFSAGDFSFAPNDLGSFLAGVFAPPALFWLMLSGSHRRSDVHLYAQSLRSELQSLLFPSEETASLINKDVERLCRQAAEVSAVSRSVLKSLQRARQGLRAEIRDFSGVSKKAEFHIERLSESLDQKGGKLLELTEEIERRTSAIDIRAQEGAESWDRATVTILERAAEMEASMGRGSEKLLEAAGKAGTQAEKIGSILTQGAKDLNSAIAGIDENLEGLGTSLESYESQIADLSERSALLVEDTRTLDGALDAALEKSTEAGEQISRKADALHVAADDIAAKADLMEDVIEKIEAASQSARAESESLMESAAEHSAKLSSAGQDNIRELKEVVALLEESRSRIESLSAVAQTQIEALNAAIETQQRTLDAAGAGLAGKVENISEALSEPLKTVQAVMREADTRCERIEGVLKQRAEGLEKSGKKAVQSAESVRDALREQVGDISTLSGRIAGDMHAINEKISASKALLDTGISESLSKMGEAEGALSRQAADIRAFGAGLAADINGISGQIVGRCAELSESGSKTFERLSEIDDALDTKIALVRDRAQAASESLLSVRTALLQTVEDVDPVCDKALERTRVVHESFSALEKDVGRIAENGLAQLTRFGSVFDERLQALRESSGEAERCLDTSGERLQLRAGEIQQTVRAAREQVEALSDALSLQSSDTHLATDQILLRLESVRAALNDQFDELSSSVGEAVARIEGAGSALEGRSQVLKNISGDSIRQLESIGSAVQAQADSAEERLSATAACLKLLVVDIEKETGRFLDATDVQISGLKKAGESLSIRAREISEQMKAALRTSVSYGKELKAQAASVAEASVLSTEQLGKSVSILTDKLRTIDTATMQVTGQIEKAGDKLTDESERLLCVSSAALEGAKEAASTFTKQSEALFKASQDAAEFAGEIGRKTTRMQRESFLDSSKFIIESLHSLSVDLSRGMEGHIPEKTWKAFQKGDVSAFTRRLNEMQENWPLEKAQAKFAQDMEFRTYVRRFIRQFEDMYDQARRGDHDALLCTTIGSSEVARLYERLCSVAGAESKLSLRGA